MLFHFVKNEKRGIEWNIKVKKTMKQVKTKYSYVENLATKN